MRKYSFTVHVVNIWNSLPYYVVDVDSVHTFHSWLDRFWLDQQIMFDWKADFTRIGNRSFECDVIVNWICLSFHFIYTDEETLCICIRSSALSQVELYFIHWNILSQGASSNTSISAVIDFTLMCSVAQQLCQSQRYFQRRSLWKVQQAWAWMTG